jgi:leucyl aminopeptidase
MSEKNTAISLRSSTGVYDDGPQNDDTVPILFVAARDATDPPKALSPAAQKWAQAQNFKGAAGAHLLLPSSDGSIEAVALGTGPETAPGDCAPAEVLLGNLATVLPPHTYACSKLASELGCVAWGLGAYRFDAYTRGANSPQPKLQLPETVDPDRVRNIVEAVWFGRDLINTPASDLGPVELEESARALADAHGADIDVIADHALIEQNFPLIHAVGRASDRRPRLIDIRWKPQGKSKTRPSITLIGKGICFDTGGLDLKPAAGMLLMKKDMGGAATALALAHMIMSQKLNVNLRVLIPAAENSVSGNAFRPSDILKSRSGRTVEVGNTDAEGRLVLADALTYATEEKPDHILTFATLTGAARVALGPDLPAMFSTDDDFAEDILDQGQSVADPVWRMPFWSNYNAMLDSKVADIGNVSLTPFAGAITAALFLKKFAADTNSYTHIDLYGWRPNDSPLGPLGGEPHAARAVFAALYKRVGTS